MRILIDARMLYGPKSGIGYYLENLIHALARIDPQNRYTLFYVSGEADPARIVRLPYPNFDTRVLRIPNPVFMRLFRDSSPLYRSARALSRAYDLVHEPGYGPLPFAPRSVVTVHDLIFFRMADQYPPAYAARYQRRMRDSAHNARLVITDSENTRRDALELLGLAPEKVRAVPLGVAPETLRFEVSEEERLAEMASLGIGKPFLLSIGDIYPRKNNLTLLRAFARLPKDVRDAHQLVIAGRPVNPETAGELEREIAALGLTGAVLLPGYVGDRARRALMNGAAVLCYPTLYEGFGLPPLEAMACGVPTVSSDNSSIPEVVGDAGLLIKEYGESEAWAEALTRVLTDDGLRTDLVTRGRERAATFTWERTARETLQVYEAAVRG